MLITFEYYCISNQFTNLSFPQIYMLLQTTKLHVRVFGGKLHVLLSHNNIETRLVSKHVVYGERLTLKVTRILVF